MSKYAQLVIGPPGAGKTTFCNGMHQFLGALGRKSSVVNLDAANDRVSYPCALDIFSLITLDDIMKHEGLGPNGGIIYALETLEANFEWLQEGLAALGDDYILFDCPGQVELFTHHDSLRRIFRRLEKLDFRLVVVNLVDSYCCTDPALYVSALLLSLKTMLQMEFPFINVLTKIDLLSQYGPLAFKLDFYAQVQDLSYLLDHLNQSHRTKRFSALNSAICELIEDFGLVSFETLAVEDKRSMARLLEAIDRAGGYMFGSTEASADYIWTSATRTGWANDMNILDVQERWIDHKDEYDKHEREEWEREGLELAREHERDTEE